MVQVEVEFTIQHTMDELKDEFIKMGHFPEWRSEKLHAEDGSASLVFFETRIVSINLHTEAERYDWFIFSLEAYGELKRRVVIPNTIHSAHNIDNLELNEFLKFCRECLVGTAAP
jgi:hypothetical protein